jgi:SAM-dependent methyltransferase/uncharacterized protein YbaR (Trm112 family)
MGAALALICPQCLVRSGAERPLGDGLVCASCGTRYPAVEGIPILLAHAAPREALASGEPPADPRTAFYQSESGYLREAIAESPRLEDALADSTATGAVLEIGSGSGCFAGVGGDDYCALDYSLSQLRRLRTGYRRICGDAEVVPLRRGSCRFVFTFATLEHVPRADAAFAEIDRVLAPGGVAYLAPAWHCREWAAEGLSVRGYRELRFSQKVRKALLPIRDSLAWRGAQQVPWRAVRRLVAALSGTPSRLKYRRLRANYERYWTSDSDACSSIDAHEGVLFFETRGYEILRPRGGALGKILARGGAVVVRKPAGGPAAAVARPEASGENQ